MSLLAIFIASFLGSAHCVGMCGGFVACYAGASGNRIAPHISYNAGRLFIYSILGALSGLLGSAIDHSGSLFGLQRTMALLTGVLLIVWGVRGIFFPGTLTAVGQSKSRLYGFIRSLFGSLLAPTGEHWVQRSFWVGSLSAFLPCGWLYSFVLLAAATGSVVMGTLTMIFFWLGTVPALASFGGITALLGDRGKKHLPILTSVLLILAGIFALYGKIGFYTPLAPTHCH